MRAASVARCRRRRHLRVRFAPALWALLVSLVFVPGLQAGTVVQFSPASIDSGIVTPGQTVTLTTQCGVLAAPANVTASIANDTFNAFKVTAVRSFVDKEEIIAPEPGEGPAGKPLPNKGFKTTVPVQMGQSDGVTPLSVLKGQYVEVDVQFKGVNRGFTNAVQGTLLINGDTWAPISIPLTGSVGELSVNVPAITVIQGKSTSVDVKVTSIAGPLTKANLIIDPEAAPSLPDVTVALKPASVTVSNGEPDKKGGQSFQPITGSSTLTATAAASLAPGTYQFNLAVWAFDNSYSFSVPVPIKVTGPKILGQLNVAETPNKLTSGVPVDFLVTANDKKTGKAVDGLKVIASSGFHGVNPIGLPPTYGVTGTRFKYTPQLFDTTWAVLILGAPNYENYEFVGGLASQPLKVWWDDRNANEPIVYGSGFIGNTCDVTVDGEGFINTKTYQGDIKTGIRVRVSCINKGQYWTIHVKSTSGGSTVTKNIPCPNP